MLSHQHVHVCDADKGQKCYRFVMGGYIFVRYIWVMNDIQRDNTFTAFDNFSQACCHVMCVNAFVTVMPVRNEDSYCYKSSGLCFFCLGNERRMQHYSTFIVFYICHNRIVPLCLSVCL